MNRTYNGQCHCGAIQFEIEFGPIEQACMCNCSICSRKGAMMSAVYFTPQQMRVTRGKDDLTLYQFGDHDVNHYFCSRCGIYPFHDSPLNPGHYRVNLACIEGLDLSALAVNHVDGASF